MVLYAGAVLKMHLAWNINMYKVYMYLHTLLQVMWQTLYSTASSRDIGTMFAARNIVNAKNVTKDPAGNYYASATMADKFTNAYIIAGALQHFGMNNVCDQPTKKQYSGELGDKEQMKMYILQQARAFVEEFVCIAVEPLPEYGPQSLSLKCRFCQKEYKQPTRLRKHEHKEHGQDDPLYNEQSKKTEKREDIVNEDLVLQYVAFEPQ